MVNAGRELQTGNGAHALARFFMTGRFADALVRVDRNDPPAASKPSYVPVHRVILASRSRVFETIFSSSPTAFEHLTTQDDSTPSSTLVGVWPLAVSDDLSLRLVLEWCYFSSVSAHSLTPLNCWAVRITADALAVEGLVQYIDFWVAQMIVEGELGNTLDEIQWSRVLVGALKAQADTELLKRLVQRAAKEANPTDCNSDTDADHEQRWEVAKYRFLRRVITREDVSLSSEEVKRLFASSVTFTKFGIPELVEAHGDPALPRDIIAEALMHTLVQRAQMPPTPVIDPVSSDQSTAATVQSPHDNSQEPNATPSSPTGRAGRPVQESQENPTSQKKETTASMEPRADTILYGDTPISAVLAKLRQSSLDYIPREFMPPSADLDGKEQRDLADAATTGDDTSSDDGNTEDVFQTPQLSLIETDMQLIAEGSDDEGAGTMRAEEVDNGAREVRSEQQDKEETSLGEGEAADVEHLQDDNTEATITLESALLSLVDGVTHSTADTNGEHAKISVLEEGPSFSDDAPLAALREVKRQVQVLMERKQQNAMNGNGTQRPPVEQAVLPLPKGVYYDRPSTPIVLDEVRRRLEDVVKTGNSGGSDQSSAISTATENRSGSEGDNYELNHEFANTNTVGPIRLRGRNGPAVLVPPKRSAKPAIRQITFAEVPTIITPAPRPGESPDQPSSRDESEDASFAPVTPGRLLGIPDGTSTPGSHMSYSDSTMFSPYGQPVPLQQQELTRPPPPPPHHRDRKLPQPPQRNTWGGAMPLPQPPLHFKSSYEADRSSNDFRFLDVPPAAENGRSTVKGGANSSFRMLGFKHVGETVAVFAGGGRKRKGIIDFFKSS